MCLFERLCVDNDTILPTESTNIALNGLVYQSSTFEDGLPSRAVDGDTMGVWKSGSCSHTEGEVRPWWAVDLVSETSVVEIEISNRVNFDSGTINIFYTFLSIPLFTLCQG